LESFLDSKESDKSKDSRDIPTKEKNVSRMEKLGSVLFGVISRLKTLESPEEKFQIERLFTTPGIKRLLINFAPRNRKDIYYFFSKYNLYVLFATDEKKKTKMPSRFLDIFRNDFSFEDHGK
jgi:hypothetical protein